MKYLFCSEEGFTQNYGKTNRKGRRGHIRAALRSKGIGVSESSCVSPSGEGLGKLVLTNKNFHSTGFQVKKIVLP
jgi:hypothetical protein